MDCLSGLKEIASAETELKLSEFPVMADDESERLMKEKKIMLILSKRENLHLPQYGQKSTFELSCKGGTYASSLQEVWHREYE